MSNSKTTTGRYLVLLEKGQSTSASVKQLKTLCGVKAKSSTEFKDEIVTASDIDNNAAIIFDKIGVAVISKKAATDKTMGALMNHSNYIVEPERIVEAIDMSAKEMKKYVAGYRDATNAMAEKVLGEQSSDFEDATQFQEAQMDLDAQAATATWGLRATRVVPPFFYRSYSGSGAKVAILDTGFDPSHPDFATRNIISQSFVPNEVVQDENGHGTHVTGTACGPLNPATSNVQRYGVAYNSDIYIGKVLNNAGSGADGWILAGINWAISQNVDVINMSLGAFTNSSGFSSVYESVASNALASGTLIIAAAGNNSSRPGTINAVSHPANCPSIMAVGAVDVNMNIARFSNGGLFPPHGSVDIVGPGVEVFSSVSIPHDGLLDFISAGEIYGELPGTSMAAPHVAGIAALYVESNGVRGQALWDLLVDSAKDLPLPARDDGAGLVQAPIRRIRIPDWWWKYIPPVLPWPPRKGPKF